MATPISRPVHHPANQWLPKELHNETWYDLDDPDALEVDNWIFDPSRGAYYAGQVIEVGPMDYIRIKWYKSVLSGSIHDITLDDNVFECTQTYSQLRKMWWIDPCA